MKVRLAVVCLAALALPLSAGATQSSLRVVFHGSGHTPKVNTHWPWSVTVTNGGKPVAGTVTAQVTCPVCGTRAVQFGATSKFVTNIRFRGRFADFVIFPPISRAAGRITFRVIVRTALGRRVVNYWIQAK